ncbi:hypothetical protein YC2023_024845 [Brassica napus]
MVPIQTACDAIVVIEYSANCKKFKTNDKELARRNNGNIITWYEISHVTNQIKFQSEWEHYEGSEYKSLFAFGMPSTTFLCLFFESPMRQSTPKVSPSFLPSSSSSSRYTSGSTKFSGHLDFMGSGKSRGNTSSDVSDESSCSSFSSSTVKSQITTSM